MILMRLHLLLEFTIIFTISSLSNGQTGDHSSATPHTHTSSIASDTGGGWDPPDPTSWSPTFSITPGISLVTSQTDPTASLLEPSLPPLIVGGRAREGYFQSQAVVELPHTLPLEGYTSLSFRTCSYGTIFKQIGYESDFVQLDLTERGILNLTLNRLGRSHSTVINNLTLNDNKWHRIYLKYELGRLLLGVDDAIEQVANTTGEFSDFLQVNLWSPDPRLIIGSSFVGCILEGSNTQISSAEARHTSVDWSSCPLPVGQNCSGYGRDPCFSQPCRNHGNCEADGDGFTCECYTRYSGRTCELDQGPLCNLAQSYCLNGGVCQEDMVGNGTFCLCPTGFTGDKCRQSIESSCVDNPCQNNGTCSLSLFGDEYQCICPTGFSGMHCQDYEGYCHFEPCLHGGVCTDQPNDFDCDCHHTGYQGDLCDVNINECLDVLRCSNDSTCFDLYGSYECACPQGFGGSRCDVDLDECISNPCMNEGTCSEGVNHFSCHCPSGFEGRMCETNIDDCFDVVCPDHSICVDGTNDYSCQCRPGYAGPSTNCVRVNGCDSIPCLNEASCFDEDSGFTCICPLGFTGDTCEINTDDCRNVYCANGGSCIDGRNNYTCLCPPGYSGLNCQTSFNQCDTDICVHATNCTELIDDYFCECDPGWTGKNCDSNIDQCVSSPCLNNSTCVNKFVEFECLCQPGFQGTLCNENIDECLTQPCFNGGFCIDLVDNYTCECPDAYMGPQCRVAYDACADQPCSNGATCFSRSGSREFQCQCVPGFGGDDCSVNIDDCQGVSCDGAQVCFDLVNTYDCRCPAGYEGANCLTEIDECQINPCQNNGICLDAVANFTCNCISGFTGLTCEEDIDECELYNPCENGICINSEGSFNCYCLPGFSGDNCTLEFDECLYKPCENGATCLDQINKYECLCAPGFAGEECQIDIDECASQPCQNGGICVDGINGFTCQCVPGFTDFVCSTNIDECESNPCLNNGSCLDGINMYECDCLDTGFKGTHCEINIDDCESSPCRHESNCTDLIKDYHCSCYDGYTGKNCEEDIMECASNPCQNEGYCYEYSNLSLYERGFFDNFTYASAGGFLCECQPGFAGDFCEININECASSPCQNGDCIDGINGYECQCLPGYEDIHCETEIDECQRFSPCLRGTCTDKIADYDCKCESLYGGKNCSIQLLGCVDVECQSGGSCVPLLFSEHVHEFRCDCPASFTGRNCEYATTMSMDGDSHLRLASNSISTYELNLDFRTTLPNVVLAVGQGNDNYFTLVLENGRVKLRSSILSRYDGIYSGNDLNNGEWQRVLVAVNETHAILSSNNETSKHIHASLSDNIFSTTYLGGVTSNLQILVSEPSYTGCLRDVRIDNRDIIPTLLEPFEKTNLIEGCHRVAQCQPNPCNNDGRCVDLWSSFQCHCKRPYLGDSCLMSFAAATFGNEDIRDSLVTVDIPEPDRPQYRQHIDISLQIRTRQPSGLIFFLGSSLQSANQISDPGLSYVLAELQNGRVVVRIRLQELEQIFEVPEPRVDNGDSHLLEVERNGEQLTVTINDVIRLNDSLSESGDLLAEVLYLGGLPNLQSVARVKRQLGINFITPTTSINNNFKGVIQDVRLMSTNETKYIQLFPLTIDPNENFDESILESQIIATDLHNVLNGTVSDDTCFINPCLEEGVCSITFNDFECDCPTGFKGKTCNELEYCAMYECPESATCQNLIDGYECLTNATFNGKNSSLIYETHSSEVFGNFSLKYRSKVGGIVMSAGTLGGSLWVGIGEGAVVVQQTNQSTLRTHFSGESLLDGDWHSLWIGFEPAGLRVSFDGVALINSDMDDSVIVDFDHIVKSSGIQVGSLPEGINLRSSVRLEDNNLVTADGGGSPSPPLAQYFRGCMGDVRVENILLPFYSQQLLLNDTARNKFIRKAELGTSIGCQVCFDYECRNEGHCSDPGDIYICSCPQGFEGSLCQYNIDECITNNCTNGAACIDGINRYYCECVAGYEGQFCETEINECLSDPCQNGGTCYDQLATFRCDCLEEFIGTTCNDLKVKNCSNNQCQNEAICNDLFNEELGFADNYSCTCTFSYEGENCELEIDFCDIRNIRCHRGDCILTHTHEGWMCKCEPGYEGSFCALETDECSIEPCMHDSKCVDKHLDFECQCPVGWMGRRCEKDVDECTDIRNLCHHGDCINTNGSYFCDCNEGYCGQHCFLRNPCAQAELNCTHGICVGDCDEISNKTEPTCECFDDYEGELCSDLVKILSPETLSIIIGVVVSLMLIVAVVGLVVFFMMAKKKRETSGTYSPSKQEYINPRVEMGNMMKPPPEERLI